MPLLSICCPYAAIDPTGKRFGAQGSIRTMATSFPTQQQQQAAAYEQYVRANWHNLSAYEQEEARAYLQAKYQYAQANTGATAAGWTLALGYICCALALVFFPIVFAPAAFGLGHYNAKHGKPNEGKTLKSASIVCGIIGMILGVIVWTSM
jgi:hypothetical protein